MRRYLLPIAATLLLGSMPAAAFTIDISGGFNTDAFALDDGIAIHTTAPLTAGHLGFVAGPEASGEIASIPLSGPVTLIGNNYDFGPRDAASDVVQLNAVMTAVREGGNPTVPGTATVDVPDMAGATAINLIYSAIGLNDSIAGSGNDAVFTVNYRDGSQDSFVWDVVDWVETSLSPLYDFAAGGLDLRSTANGGLYFDEQGRLFEQTFTVDSGKIIDSFGFDVSGMNDTGQQTNVLVFAASATGFVSLAEPAIVPAPAALGLLAVAALGIVATRRH